MTGKGVLICHTRHPNSEETKVYEVQGVVKSPFYDREGEKETT